MEKKEVIIIAGSNGVGKTTWSGEFLADHPDFTFLNADNVAKEIAPEDPEGNALAAGRIFLRSVSEMIEQGRPFLLESTLSGHYLVRLIEKLRKNGYSVRIVFLFVDSTETVKIRIRGRVKKGGHFVPDADVERRFLRGRRKFWTVYRTLVDSWELFYNEGPEFLRVAGGDIDTVRVISEHHFAGFMELIDETSR